MIIYENSQSHKRRYSLWNICSFGVVISAFGYALSGNVGACIIVALVSIVALQYIIQPVIYVLPILVCWTIYIVYFACIQQIFRTYSFEFYLVIGYITITLILLHLQTEISAYDALYKNIKIVALFEGFSIYLQLLFPSLYYNTVSVFMKSSAVAQIQNRAGYYTGFTREVSFTALFIVLGIGLYFFDLWSNNRGGKRKTRLLALLFLFGSLLITGKKGQLLFCVLSIGLIIFIFSNKKLKILRGTLLIAAVFAVAAMTYRYWSLIPTFTRLAAFINEFTNAGNIVELTSGRSIIYTEAIKLWHQNIWFGIGWGNFKYAVSADAWYHFFDVHDCYLQVLCETGVVGAIAYYLLTSWSVVQGIRCLLILKKKFYPNRPMLLFAVYYELFFVLYSITGTCLYEYSYYVFYFLSIGIISVFLQKCKMKNSLRSFNEACFAYSAVAESNLLPDKSA